MWYVISEYSDRGDYEILAQGAEADARAFFDTQLKNEAGIKGAKIRNATGYQFEVWVEGHYQYDMKPGCAYTVKLTDRLPLVKKH